MQDIQDAEDEEEAAKDLHQESMKNMREDDFQNDYSSSEDSAASDNGDPEGSRKKRKSKGKKKDDKLNKELQVLALGSPSNGELSSVERLARDVSKMTKSQKLSLIAAESPELLSLISELRERVTELRDKIGPIRALISEFNGRSLKTEEKDESSLQGAQIPQSLGVDDEVVAYLEVKFQLLLAYCINVCFYLALKCEGASVKAHPVMKQLLELRYAMEKIRPLDGKLKYQIDRLINVANMSSEERNTLGLRPNLNAFLDEGEDEEDDEVPDQRMGQSDEGSSVKPSGSVAEQNEALYRAPKLSATPYRLEESREEKEARKQQRKKNRLKNSAIYESLQEEFGIAPEMASSSGIDRNGIDDKALQAEIDERQNFEEDRFVRLTMTRKDKKAMKKRHEQLHRLDNLTDLGDISGIDQFDDLKVGRTKKASIEEQRSIEDSDATAAALRKAMAAFSQSIPENHISTSKKRGRMRDFEMDEIDIDGDDEGFDGVVEDFGRKKKAYESSKASHYAAEPRYGGMEPEEIEEGKKRAASYEMIKNRGLTPHRKKSSRNPRVKKREAFEKALIRRKGQVREVITGEGDRYGGESTGIKSSVSKSRKILN